MPAVPRPSCSWATRMNSTSSAPRAVYMANTSIVITESPVASRMSLHPVVRSRRHRWRCSARFDAPVSKRSDSAEIDASRTAATRKLAASTTNAAVGDHAATTTAPMSGPTNVITWRTIDTWALADANPSSPATSGSAEVKAGRYGAAIVYPTATRTSSPAAPTSLAAANASMTSTAPRSRSSATSNHRRSSRSARRPAGALISALGPSRATAAIPKPAAPRPRSNSTAVSPTQNTPSPRPDTTSIAMTRRTPPGSVRARTPRRTVTSLRYRTCSKAIGRLQDPRDEGCASAQDVGLCRDHDRSSCMAGEGTKGRLVALVDSTGIRVTRGGLG